MARGLLEKAPWHVPCIRKINDEITKLVVANRLKPWYDVYTVEHGTSKG